jgi:hypothetical protein
VLQKFQPVDGVYLVKSHHWYVDVRKKKEQEGGSNKTNFSPSSSPAIPILGRSFLFEEKEVVV